MFGHLHSAFSTKKKGLKVGPEYHANAGRVQVAEPVSFCDLEFVMPLKVMALQSRQVETFH